MGKPQLEHQLEQLCLRARDVVLSPAARCTVNPSVIMWWKPGRTVPKEVGLYMHVKNTMINKTIFENFRVKNSQTLNLKPCISKTQTHYF